MDDPCARQFEGERKDDTMQITSFKDMYIAELQELTSLEGQLGEALRRMAKAASHPSLKNALTHHQEQTQAQKQRLESILQTHGANPQAHTDQAMQALINETEKMMKMVKGDNLRDAALIASIQKVKHYEIAAYGTAASLAGQLDLRDDQRLLHESLEEEKESDAVLTRLAKSEVNRDALAPT
jgi:ferritin-like metal-binding protein YciE